MMAGRARPRNNPQMVNFMFLRPRVRPPFFLVRSDSLTPSFSVLPVSAPYCACSAVRVCTTCGTSPSVVFSLFFTHYWTEWRAPTYDFARRSRRGGSVAGVWVGRERRDRGEATGHTGWSFCCVPDGMSPFSFVRFRLADALLLFRPCSGPVLLTIALFALRMHGLWCVFLRIWDLLTHYLTDWCSLCVVHGLMTPLADSDMEGHWRSLGGVWGRTVGRERRRRERRRTEGS